MDGEQQNSSEPQPECPGCRALRKEVAELRRIIEELRRAGKRQAGPFSKGPPKPKPKRPGRKPGDEYGTPFSLSVPTKVDETYQAELPQACPHCGGTCVTETHVNEQFQTEVVTTVVQRKFVVHIGLCGTCHERVQGRHLPRAACADPRKKNQLQVSAGRQLPRRTSDSSGRGESQGLGRQRFRQSPIDLLLPRPSR